MSQTFPETSSRPGAWSLLTFGAAAACVVAACWAWGESTPALGERPFSASRIAAARWAGVALWSAAHVVLFGLAVPMVYRRRPVYGGLAGIFGLAAVLAAITAGALFAAAANGR